MAVTINASTSAGLVQTADTSGVLQLQTAGTTALTVDTSANVGIGTASPVNSGAGYIALTVNGSTQSGTNFQVGGVSTGYIYSNASDSGIGTLTATPYKFTTNGSERMRIDSSGNVGIGTTSAFGKLNVVQSSDTQIAKFSATSYGLTFNSDAGTGFRIEAADATGVGSYQPLITNGSLQAFRTGNTERMRIDSSGFTYINCTSSVASVSSYSNIAFNGVNYFGISIKTTYAGAGSTFAAFINSAGTQQGAIYANATNTTQYQTSSDYRLKENIAPMIGALDTVAQLKPCTFKWKSDGSASQGFIAHELQAVVPECVGGEKDAVDADGNPKYQGVDTSFLVATLTAALQEAHGLIKDLQARVDALEAK